MRQSNDLGRRLFAHGSVSFLCEAVYCVLVLRKMVVQNGNRSAQEGMGCFVKVEVGRWTPGTSCVTETVTDLPLSE